MEKWNEAENYVLLPLKWFRYYLYKTNKITLNVFDKEIVEPHFDESFIGMRMMFEDYDPIPKEIQDFYNITPYIRRCNTGYNTIQKEIENRYKNYIQTLMPIEVNLDHFTVYVFTRKDTQKLMKIIDINDLFEKAYLHIQKYKDNLPVEMWRKGDMVVFDVGITHDASKARKRWYVNKVCNKIVKLEKTGHRRDEILYKIKYIRENPYCIIRDNEVVKYNTERGEYYLNIVPTPHGFGMKTIII